MSNAELHRFYVDYARGAGGILAGQVNEAVLNEVCSRPVSPLTTRQAKDNLVDATASLSPSAQGLFLVASVQFGEMVDNVWRKRADHRYSAYNIASVDYAKAKEQFRNSPLADIDFAPRFAAAAANGVVQTLVNENRITEAEYNAMNLRDWANVIGTGWFSRLIHSMAFAGGNMYTQLGRQPDEYAAGAFTREIRRRLRILDPQENTLVEDHEPVFVGAEEYEPADGSTYVTASITDNIDTILKRCMRHDKDGGKRYGVGCPAAYDTYDLDGKALNNPFVQAAIASGGLVIGRTIKRHNDVELRRVEQKYTAIDTMLIRLANYLDKYDELYGMPKLELEKRSVTIGHDRVPSVDALRFVREPA